MPSKGRECRETGQLATTLSHPPEPNSGQAESDAASLNPGDFLPVEIQARPGTSAV